MLTNTDQPCVLELQSLYSICFAHTNCESCSQSSGCGWCLATNTCMPGDSIAPSCRNDCFNRMVNWVTVVGKKTCPGGPTSGLLTNIAPESKNRLIKPELRETLGASGPWITEVKNDMHDDKQIRVISGDFSNLATSARHVITPE